jgi:hypothetical protein
MDTLSFLQTQTAPSEAVGPMKPLQGPTLIAGGSLKERVTHRSSSFHTGFFFWQMNEEL